MSFRIGLVPLDDRPCNWEQLVDLARVAGIEVLAPAASEVSSLERTHRHDELHAWLEATLPSVNALVLSLDNYLYGGLIRSRRLEISEETAVTRMKKLDALLGRHPGVKVYLSNVLLRISITVNQEQSEDDWRNMFRFSVLSDKVSVDPDPALKQELEEVRARIRPALLDEYLAVRKRNHRVNREVLRMSTPFGYVLLGQEDCAEYGFHRLEKRALREEVARLPEERRSRTLVLTGADELGAMLLMRAAMDQWGVKERTLELPVRVSDPEGLGRISNYEDIPLGESIALHLHPSPFRQCDSGGGGPQLHVVPFGKEGQRDMCFLRPGNLRSGLDLGMAEFLESVKPGDGWVDFSFANGADPALTEALGKKTPLEGLGAFSTWNTTGNRLGTLVAHLALHRMATGRGCLDERADRWFLLSQVLDGYVYQSLVRTELSEQAEKEGLNVWALGDAWNEWSGRVNQEMIAAAGRLGLGTGFKAALPWPRLFEVSVRGNQ